MELHYIEGNRMMLDGGSMFGNAAKELWKRWVTPDELNRIPLATRCVLLKGTPHGNILLDAGAGHYLSKDILKRYEINEGCNTLIENLKSVGVPHEKIDIVLLSHLHFDHVGGLVDNVDGTLQLLFPNASYYIGEGQWERAKEPHHPRDRVYSMIQEIMDLLIASGRMKMINNKNLDCLSPTLSLSFSNGHAYEQIIIKMQIKEQKYVFPTDLIPGRHWVNLPITMGYDRNPELIVNEKTPLLKEIYKDNAILIFVHDPDMPACRIEKNEKGSFVPVEV